MDAGIGARWLASGFAVEVGSGISGPVIHPGLLHPVHQDECIGSAGLGGFG
jgi:hypothetical protein